MAALDKPITVTIKSAELADYKEQFDRIEAGQARIEAKLDALLDALVDEQDDVEDAGLTLDGDDAGSERDSNEPL